MELENVKLTAKYYQKVSNKGTQYNCIEIYYGETFITTVFVDKTASSLIEIISKTQNTQSINSDLDDLLS